MLVKCSNCGKELDRTLQRILQQKNHFCSMKCKGLFQQIENEITFRANHGEIIIRSKRYGIKNILFDLDDLELINKYRWNIRFDKCTDGFYARAEDYSINKRNIVLFHRLVTDCPKGLVVDHINHDTLDNRKQNLEVCTSFKNNQNRLNNTSGYIGVGWDKSRNKWQANIKVKGKKIYLGRFTNIEDAIIVRKNAEKLYYNYG